MNSVDCMHAYCQWPNDGSIWPMSNFRRASTLAARRRGFWKRGSSASRWVETAHREIVHKRGRDEPALRQLDTYEEMVQPELMLERHTLGVAAVAALLLPHARSSLKSRRGSCSTLQKSSPPLRGQSYCARRRLAVRHDQVRPFLGVARTYVCNCCQGVKQHFPREVRHAVAQGAGAG